MIYLLIPKGMEFKQIFENGKARDYLVDPNAVKPKINLQELVKDALRVNTGRKWKIKAGEITIYRKNPPLSSDTFLEYTPNHNGKFATTEPVRAITGHSSQTMKMGIKTTYGQFWFEQMNLSAAKKAEILAKRNDVQQNRRHEGDCPKPT